jgi:hypothetical protein
MNNTKSLNKNTVSINIEGGLGNQLFKIFFIMSYSINHNKKFIINEYLQNQDSSILDPRHTYWTNIFKNIINNRFDNNKTNLDFTNKYYEQTEFYYNEIPFFDTDTIFYGYYQNYRYFDNNYDKIVSLLNLNDLKIDIFNKCLKNKHTISMHFRLGDYKNLKDIFILLNINYYIQALQHIVDNDIYKCNEVLCVYEYQDEHEINSIIEQLKNKFPTIIFNKISHQLEDWEQLLLMSVCQHNIIANSTFSWWGAYINTNINKIVCYPEKWFVNSKNEQSGLSIAKWKMIQN